MAHLACKVEFVYSSNRVPSTNYSNQEISGLEQHAHQGHTRTLTTAEYSYFFENIIPTEQETAQQITHQRACFSGGGRLHTLQHGLLIIQHICMGLGEKGYLCVVTETEFSGIRGLCAGDKAGKGGLADLLPWGDSRSTPRSMSALERNPQVPDLSSHKVLGPGISGRGIPKGPRGTRMGTGLS